MVQSESFLGPVQRIRVWYALLLLVSAVFIVRLFYLQVIRHDYYQNKALASQLKEYEIPAERGVIEAHTGDSTVPVVLNETLYTLYADPVYVEDPKSAAADIAKAIGGDISEYEQQLGTEDTRYVVLAKKLDKEQSEKISELDLKGIGTREVPYRTYPQGGLAAQVLGFVNDEGQGKYGVEQALDDELKGTPGQLKAITDAAGVPLAANEENVNIEPEQGKRVVLTLDVGMQQQLEDLLKAGLKRAISDSGSALIMDAKTGAVKAMASFPTYNPANFYEVNDGNKFKNNSLDQLEVGSIMKPLTAAAALDLGVVHKDQTYYDPSRYEIDEAVVSNIEEDGGAGTRSVRDILQLSLNTGATWLLMQMGGGEINQQARERWHSYMVDHFQLGKPTGVEQGYEESGTIPDPNDGFGLNIRYANTSFGQGMSATPLQMGAALSSVVNGGTYHKPFLVEKTIDASGQEHSGNPQVVREKVVSKEVSRTIRNMMEYTIEKNKYVYGFKQDHPAYSIGGKTGTAEVVDPETGVYYDDVFNGMFMGFVGGDEPQYVIVVRVDKPKIPGYAGSQAAAPLFVDLSNMLINNFGVVPKGS